jgi:NADPH:quinone reductase
MRAARFHDWGTDPRVEEIREPERRPGEVLVRMQASSLSHLDLTVASGSFGMHPELPYVGGVEGSAAVVAADDLAPNTQVLVRGGGVGLLRDGTWAEFVSVPRKSVTVLPHALPPDVAATFYQPTSTAYVAVHDIAQLKAGERVIVVGAAGAVGSQVVQQALMVGADVIGVVGRSEQIARIPHGAHPVVIDDDLATARLAKDRSASVLVDTFGGDGLVGRSHWVEPGGRAVVIGYVTGTSATFDLPSWLLDDVALLPVNMIRKERRAREVSAELIGQLARGELHIDVERFDIADISSALQQLRTGHIRGRGVITFPTPAEISGE